MNIIDLAWQIIDMDRTIREQNLEIIRLQKIEADYYRFVDNAIKHDTAMINNLLEVLLKPNVSEAFLKKY